MIADLVGYSSFRGQYSDSLLGRYAEPQYPFLPLAGSLFIEKKNSVGEGKFFQKKTDDLNYPPSVIPLDISPSPGDSGGPLLNCEGHIIGVTRAGLNDLKDMSSRYGWRSICQGFSNPYISAFFEKLGQCIPSMLSPLRSCIQNFFLLPEFSVMCGEFCPVAPNLDLIKAVVEERKKKIV